MYVCCFVYVRVHYSQGSFALVSFSKYNLENNKTDGNVIQV